MHSNYLEGRYTIDGVGRLYTDNEDLWLPSVSTVLEMRDTPAALENWKQRQDDYEAVMAYTQNRGTLAHEQCLQELAPDDQERIWGKEEEASVWGLKDSGELERARGDLATIASLWATVTAVVNTDAVLDVETYVANTDVGYAGQFDLLYQDHSTDETVLADLKTSSNVYDKHLLQLVAYKHAVPMAIDRMEVIRLNPEQRDWRVLGSHEWDADPDELWTEFIRLRGELEQQKLATILDQIQDADTDQDGVLYEPM